MGGRREDARRGGSCSTRPEPLPFVADACPPTRTCAKWSRAADRGTWWEQTHLRRAVRADPPDVFFAGAYTAPLALGVPLAVTIHDVSFAAHPEWFRPREGARRRLLTRQAARAAEVVFTDSEFSRGEILERLSVARRAGPGHSARRDAPVPGARRRASRWCSSSDRSSTAGGCRRLIAAFAAATATRPEARLVIAGADRSYPALDLAGLAAEAGVGDRVEISEYVAEAELDALYRARRCSCSSPSTKGSA